MLEQLTFDVYARVARLHRQREWSVVDAVLVVRAFRPASKLFILVITSGLQPLQPARDLLFDFPQPAPPHASKRSYQ
jgi:hypothetical protein